MHRAETIATFLLTLFLAGAIVAGMVAIVSIALGPYGIRLSVGLFVKLTLWASVFILIAVVITDVLGG